MVERSVGRVNSTSFNSQPKAYCQRIRVRLRLTLKHFVVKLVKSFGRLVNAAEGLDEFRYGLFSQMHFMNLDETFGIG